MNSARARAGRAPTLSPHPLFLSLQMARQVPRGSGSQSARRSESVVLDEGGSKGRSSGAEPKRGGGCGCGGGGDA